MRSLGLHIKLGREKEEKKERTGSNNPEDNSLSQFCYNVHFHSLPVNSFFIILMLIVTSD